MGNEFHVELKPHVVDVKSHAYADILKETFDFGAVILSECFKQTADGDEAKLIPALLFRNICRQVLGSAVLAREGLAESCNLTARALLEACVSLLYMLEGDTTRKAAAYRVVDVLDGIALTTSISPFTEEGKELRRKLQDDRIGKLDNPLFDKTPDAKKELEEVLRELRKDPAREDAFCEYEKIMQEKSMKRGGKRVAWYWLFGGPRSFKRLAEETKMLYCYETVYYLTSKAAHGLDAMRNAAVPVTIGTTDIPIGSTKDIDSTAAAVINLAMISYKEMISRFCPYKAPAFNEWLGRVRATLTKTGLYPVSNPSV